MFIGKWNKSVIITYLGLLLSIIGIYFGFLQKINLAFSCLIIAGVCDLLDGAVARKCKRNDIEKKFGIELDSLVDVIDFIIFPIVIYINLGLTSWHHLIIYFIYAVCGVCRLAYFNISLEEENKDTPIKYYKGLPVTAVALLFPLLYLLGYILISSFINIYMILIMIIISFLFIFNFKLKKPKVKAYPFFILLAIITIIIYVGVL